MTNKENELVRALVDNVSRHAHDRAVTQESLGGHYGVNYNRRVGELVADLHLSPELENAVRKAALDKLR